MNNLKLRVSEIQRFCMHDGPGIRTTVFFKGCPMHCKWCHNPETNSFNTEVLFYSSKCIDCGSCKETCQRFAITDESPSKIYRDKCDGCGGCSEACPTGALSICGEDMTVSEIVSIIKKDEAFYGDLGGVTLSGGEPFAQGESVIALLKECKENGITTVVETSGYADTELLLKAVPYVDLFLWDIKDTNDDRHIYYTGASNKLCLDNLMAINTAGAKIGLRCILVNGVNTDVSHYNRVTEIAKSIRNLERVEAIPYHAYGGSKAIFLGREDNGNVEWIPTKEQINEFYDITSGNII